MGDTNIAYTAHIDIVHCYKCSAPIALGNKSVLLGNKAEFYCPNGHTQAFVGTEMSKLKADLVEERRRTEQEKQRREMAEREVVMERKLRMKADRKHAREKKRIVNGVCTCCNRTFANLAAHMKTKHPEEVAKAK